MKIRFIINRQILIVFLLLSTGRLCGQETENIRITDVSGVIEDDSLRVRFSLCVSGLKIKRQESLSLLPRITNGKTPFILPAVVYSGSLRKKYDERRRVFSSEPPAAVYHVYTDVRKDREYRLEYEWAVPYPCPLQNEHLVVEYRYEGCSTCFYPVREKSYALQVEQPEKDKTMAMAAAIAAQLAETKAVVPPAEIKTPEQTLLGGNVTVRQNVIIRQPDGNGTVPAHAAEQPLDDNMSVWKKETLYLEYPVNIHRIIPSYGSNPSELARLDKMIGSYWGKVKVTAYASPEGPYDNNVFLAQNRAESFKKYVSEHYGIHIDNISVSFVPEDWDGLRELIAESSYHWKGAALEIIDNVDIFAGREKRLMDLYGGVCWRQMVPFFLHLRRIEVEIVDKDFE